ncbi:MAG: hypothetical protein Q8R40_02530 [bacterium]|nr:hypothetical protein [bacterium]
MKHARRYYFDYPMPERPDFESYTRWLMRQARMTPPVSDALDRARGVMSEHKRVCYIAGALTEATSADKERYEIVSRIAGEHGMFGYAPHLYGTDPVRHPSVTPREVRDIDYLWAVVMPDLHINFLCPIAHGNAIEQGWAECFCIPTVYVADRMGRISRLPAGMFNILEVIRYNDIDEAYRRITTLFTELKDFNPPREERIVDNRILEYLIHIKFLRSELINPA